MRGTSMGTRRGRLPARLLVGVLACAAMALGAASVFAATSSTPYEFEGIPAPHPQLNSEMPERLTTAQDIDGDGLTDIYASTFDLDVNGLEDVGRVYLFSGATRNLIRQLEAPDQQEDANFGFYISVPGDVNGDGIEDVSVGAPGLDVDGNENQGRLYVFDGRTGSLLHSIDHPDEQAGAGFAGRIGAAGDVNGDGFADVIAGAPGQDRGEAVNAGKAFVFSGRDKSLLREYVIPEEDLTCVVGGIHQPGVSCGSLGHTVQVIGDLNADGVPDHMVGAGSYDGIGRIYVFSGADGTVLTRIDPPEQGDPSSFFGLFDPDRYTPGDLTGDGVPEIYGAGFQLDRGLLVSAGRAWVFDGAKSLQAGEGVVLYEVEDPNPADGKAFGWAVSKTNYNNDGVTDLLVSNLANHEGSAVPQEAYVIDGRNGEALKTLELPSTLVEVPEGEDNGTGFGWSSRALGDVNGDCQPDYAAAAP
ncbi:MAG: integrin alpha, partial [Actinomycetota bacterium]|nr:integrin alpha [Actinomycetota bacterium]